jgi:hypothetical protein
MLGAKAWLIFYYDNHENKGIDMQKLAVVTALSILYFRPSQSLPGQIKLPS